VVPIAVLVMVVTVVAVLHAIIIVIVVAVMDAIIVIVIAAEAVIFPAEGKLDVADAVETIVPIEAHRVEEAAHAAAEVRRDSQRDERPVAAVTSADKGLDKGTVSGGGRVRDGHLGLRRAGAGHRRRV